MTKEAIKQYDKLEGSVRKQVLSGIWKYRNLRFLRRKVLESH